MRQTYLTREELHQVKFLLGVLLALIAFWTLHGLESARGLLLNVSTMAVAAVLIFPSLAGRIPALFWRILVPFLLLGILADFFLNQADMIPPLIRMVTILLLVRCLSYRTRREDLQLILLSLFMAIISGVLTMSLLFGFQVILFTPVAMSLLFVISLLESSRDEVLTLSSWKDFSWKVLLGRIRHVLDRRMILLTGGLFTVMVIVSSLIFVIIPRFRFDQAIPFLQMRSVGLTGFSDTIELGGVTEIAQDNRVALRLDPPGRDSIPDNPYFRMLVLDQYQDGQFSLSRSARTRPGMVRSFQSARIDAALAGRWSDLLVEPVGFNVWTFYLEGGISKYLPILGPFKTMRFTRRQQVESNLGFLVINIDHPSTSVFSYQVFSMNPTNVLAASRIDREELPNSTPVLAPRASPVWRTLEYPQTLLAVPVDSGDAQYLLRVVGEITRGEKLTAEEFGRRAVAYLGERHEYSLSSSIRARGRDQVVAWLQEGSPGHCEYFAAAFTLLARTAGFPTRVVVGFNGGSWNTVEDYFVVRNRNAHAWCEIFDGESRWIRVDPTPGAERMQELGQVGFGRFPEDRGWEAWFDSLRILWYRRVVHFDQTSQQEIVTHIRQLGRDLIENLRQSWVAGIKGWREWMVLPWSWDRMVWLGMAAFIGVATVVIWQTRVWWLTRLWKFRWVERFFRARQDPLRRRAGRVLQQLESVRAGKKEAEDGEEWDRVWKDLQSLRFGDLTNREEAPRIFRRARRLRKPARMR